MTNAYVTEIIWHFAGYLQIFGTVDADRGDLSGGADALRSPGFAPGEAGWIAPPSDEEGGGGAAMRFNLRQAGPAPVPKSPLADSAPDVASGAAALFAPGFFDPPDGASFAKAAGAAFAAKPAGAAGPTPYALSWGEGGDGRLVDILQSNRLHDGDLVLNLEGALAEGAPPRLAEMAREAVEALPEWLEALPEQGYEWADFLANRAPEVFADAPFVAPGVYRDGEAIAPGDAPVVEIALPEADPPERPSPHAVGEAIATGDNLQVNQALIVDAMTATRTLAVMGDVHLRDAIVQAIVHAGTGDAPAASGAQPDDDLIANVARFSSTPYGKAAPGWIPSSGLTVNVDIADTSILDIRMLAQRNLGDDSDRVGWAGTDAWTQMALGGNVQINAASLLDFGASYDVIIVLGDYFALNLIVQVAVLDDVDHVASLAGAGGGVEARAGGNVVFNDATIENMGVHGWAATPSALEALAAALARGEDPGMEAFAGLAGAATGRLDILVVTGDWYDVNVVWQVNMLADADEVLLAGEHDATAATGGNMLVNTATILDFGAIDAQYVGGDVYHDLLLFQANIAYEDQQGVVYGDPGALAGEFIAFLEPDSIQTDDGAASAPAPATAHEDALGGVMA